MIFFYTVFQVCLLMVLLYIFSDGRKEFQFWGVFAGLIILKLLDYSAEYYLWPDLVWYYDLAKTAFVYAFGIFLIFEIKFSRALCLICIFVIFSIGFRTAWDKLFDVGVSKAPKNHLINAISGESRGL